jgi:N-acetylmuramoyl-L-alanine amidase
MSKTWQKPKTTFILSPNFSARSIMTPQIDCLIVHHTGGSRIDGTIATFQNDKSDVSSHYVVGCDGSIVQMVTDDKKAWHAGKSHLFNWNPTDMNSRSIGVEVVNKGDNIQPYSSVQIVALAELTRFLVQTYSIPSRQVLGHREVCLPHGRKVDPSDNFPWRMFRWLVWGNENAGLTNSPLPLPPEHA